MSRIDILQTKRTQLQDELEANAKQIIDLMESCEHEFKYDSFNPVAFVAYHKCTKCGFTEPVIMGIREIILAEEQNKPEII